MKTITEQATVIGQVETVQSNDQDYVVEFVIKTIREGEVAWFNATATGWEAWNLKAGDKVSLTGQLTKSVWRDPFENDEVEAFEMKATSLELAI